MRRAIFLLLAMLLTGCAGQAISQTPASVPANSPASVPANSPASVPAVVQDEPDQPNQKRFKLTLSLSTPADLKVREGDAVTAGQLLSDRTDDRQKLEAQLQQLDLQIAKLQTPAIPPPPPHPIPELAALPDPGFLTEVADREAARLKASQQVKTIAALETMKADLPAATLDHEQAKLAQAQGDVSLAEAKLDRAKGDRQYREYQHSLEVSKRAIALQQAELERQRQLAEEQKQERDRSYQLADLASKKQLLTIQLDQLSAVRSPYPGKVHRVKFIDQKDRALTVDVTLLIPANPGSPAASSTNRKASPAPTN